MEYPDKFDELSELDLFRPDPRIANFLWRGWIPVGPEVWPTYPIQLNPLMLTPVETLMLTRPHIGHWDYKLVLGVDAQFRGFEVRYEYEERTVQRSVSIATAMHYFFMEADERITRRYITGKDKIEGIRFVTDMRQHFIVGRPGPEERGLAREGKNVETIEGFHFRWSDDRNSSLASLGVLKLKGNSIDSREEPVDKDYWGHYWTPERPQTRFPIAEIGQIHGRTHKIKRLRYPGPGVVVPSRQAVVTWLDCSKPIETISITMCHISTTEFLMITSITFEYAEGHEPMSFGPTLIDSPEHEKGVKNKTGALAYMEVLSNKKLKTCPTSNLLNGAFMGVI
ncbi:hypothetical protein FGADI_6257 [Fusarium gaditjirri]|uniref:Uncharacterized protein n=1 Tax=Fusarium gaditjirri TaxID=282569 RepID=A0A8H4T839_9HYPO|nr:hypothetical protein FGADI_6257 [Fusarium gaditjirri]